MRVLPGSLGLCLRPGVGLLLFLTVAAAPAFAQVVRLPPIVLPPPFAQELTLLDGADTWADYRWYADRQGTPELGTDFELGVRGRIISTGDFALTGVVRMLYQARHLEEYRNPLVFSPRHLTTDLRLMAYGNLDPVILHGGWRHDCTHAVDDEDSRTPIHDTLLVGAAYELPQSPWRGGAARARGRVHAEAEVNVPALFVDTAERVDRGRLTAGFDVEPFAHERYGAGFAAGHVSFIVRDTDSPSVDGVKRRNIDWSMSVGYRTPGERGRLSVYGRVERLTDPWLGPEVEPVTVPSVGAILQFR